MPLFHTLEEIRRSNMWILREVLLPSRQVTFAEMIGLNQTEVSKYERGQSQISDLLAKKIEKEFGLQAGWMDRSNADILMAISADEIALLDELRTLPAKLKPAISTLASELKIGLSNG